MCLSLQTVFGTTIIKRVVGREVEPGQNGGEETRERVR